MTFVLQSCHPERSEGSAVGERNQSASFGKQTASLVSALAALLVLSITAVIQARAQPCFSELNKVVRATHGRATSPGGNIVEDAEIRAFSSSGETVFKTTSRHDGTFQLAVNPGKYRVEVSAQGYIRFRYVVDLRSKVGKDTFDVPLRSNRECNDIRIADEEEDRCSLEAASPNLILPTTTVIAGHVRDETSAPFKNAEILLRKVAGSPLQPSHIEAKTDGDGYFRFEEAEPGKYRLLASQNRGFAQPEKLDCYERRDCTLEIILKANPTGLPYAGCPVQ